MRFKSIAVFCASSPGFDAVWTQRAYGVGEFLATQNITLVYGGGRVGLMGAVADGALANNGKVVGVIPHFLNSKEIGHSGVTDLIAVDNMHQRKTLMNDLSEAFIALPGGYGTMEEVFEVITWGQLGLHQKPVGLLNINGFYDHLIAFLQNMVDVGLLKKQNQEMLLVGNTIEELLEKMNSYVAPAVPKWLSKENS
ncbi:MULTISPECIES: TIGR00730 family Rossman fold protein [Sphingobacterium]|uniref:Cytokinin riboside 5'-monophosphate phosphoribohydrolase n=1 Tax=Sphingobacterium litopenaei TaxID=2763500 RepID=A0ABR7YIL0_9SPHI|nr:MULTISPECIES: TIGR00730 family Rossman fold protein [Sphingobacterium]MBD1431122.1 TIGR00730 family Rossman fold protein [Sphingobacterium litopenaei]NGM74800.1 TIGR00730 family Rossman fold protein [Sphingobacterium sp. SGL-16]